MAIDLKDMLQAGIHFGHKTSRWSPRMRPYIWGAKNKVHLIDVSKTAFLLEKTGKFLKDLAAEGGVFLWVGTKKPAQGIMQTSAANLKMPYVIHRWVGGTLSNFEQVKKAITRLLHLRDVANKPTAHYTKKELVMIQKEIERLEKNVGGIVDLTYPPAAVIVVDAKKEHSAVKEAARLGIPVIAMVDTNTDPQDVSFVIPSNDDSPKAIKFVMNYLESCIQEGLAVYKEKKPKKEVRKPFEKEAVQAVAPVLPEALLEETEEEGEESTGRKKKSPVTAEKKPLVKKVMSKGPIKRSSSKS